MSNPGNAESDGIYSPVHGNGFGYQFWFSDVGISKLRSDDLEKSVLIIIALLFMFLCS